MLRFRLRRSRWCDQAKHFLDDIRKVQLTDLETTEGPYNLNKW